MTVVLNHKVSLQGWDVRPVSVPQGRFRLHRSQAEAPLPLYRVPQLRAGKALSPDQLPEFPCQALRNVVCAAANLFAFQGLNGSYLSSRACQEDLVRLTKLGNRYGPLGDGNPKAGCQLQNGLSGDPWQYT